MEIHNPSHPGEVLRELYLNPLGLNVTQTAKALEVTRKTLSELLNGKSGISPVMAMRLAIAFKTTPELWLNMQLKYDLWKAKSKVELSNVKVLREAA